MARNRAVLGWVLYDFANVIFALGVVGLHLPLWIVDEQGGRDRHVAIATSLSMLVVMFLSPRLGKGIDRTGKRVAPLAICTVTCVVLTTMIGTGGLAQSMVIFGLANVAFGCGLVFYDALLPVVSTATNRGQISGRGIAAGFGGALIAVVIGIVILAIAPDAKPLVFVVLAGMFLIGSIPCFLWVKDPAVVATVGKIGQGFMAAVARSREVPGMSRFLIGRVLYTDAANTLFAFMSIYAVKEMGFSDLQTQLVLLFGILAGPVGAIGAGKMADRIGSKPTLERILILWMLVLAMSSLIPMLGLPRLLFWLAAPLGGLAFGSTGTVDRALLVELSPPEETGTFFGLFSMVGRFSSLIGPLMWALVADWLGHGRPIAVATLMLLTATAYWLFRGLPSALSDRRSEAVTFADAAVH